MDTVTDKDQVYTIIDAVPYTRKDGTTTLLEVWEASCTFPGCTHTYTVTVPAGATPATTKSFGRRRCDLHKLTRAEVIDRWQASIKAGREARKKLQITTPK